MFPHLFLAGLGQDILDGALVVLELVPFHLVQPQIEQRLRAQRHHHQPEVDIFSTLVQLRSTLPQVGILLCILRVGELHDVFDEVQGLVVHVVGVYLVAQRLCSTGTYAEEHDSLCNERFYQNLCDRSNKTKENEVPDLQVLVALDFQVGLSVCLMFQPLGILSQGVGVTNLYKSI